MQAIILVGGRGTRLQPLTDTRPKPMLPILGVPFLEHQLRYLRGHGVDAVTFACGFLPSSIVSCFGEGEALGMRLSYVIEPEPLDTAGAIAFAARTMDPQRLLVCNGDVLTDLDITELVAEHERRGAVATIALTPVEDPSRYGLVRTDAEHAVTAFVEKPPPEECDTNLINAGTYVLEPEVIELVPADRRCNIEREIFPALVGQRLYAIGFEGYWNDIGTFESYRRANADALAGRIDGIEPSRDRDTWIHPDAKVASGATVERGSVIGAGAVVEDGAWIAGSVVLEGAFIGRDASIEDAIIGEGGRVEPGVSLPIGEVVAPA